MNLSDLREDIYRFMGLSGHNIPDHVKQQVTDDINRAQDKIYRALPFVWWMVKSATLTPVTGTSVYTLDDYCVKPLSFWTADSSAHKIPYFSARDADRSGVRNTNLGGLESGPFAVHWHEPTTTAGASGVSGSSYGASVTEGDTALAKGSSGTAWTSADTGKLVYLNGEDADFTITYVSANAATLDRAYRGRLSGLGTTGVGSGLSQVRWEMVPKGRQRVFIPQAATGGASINYRFHKLHRRLINTDETPEAPTDWHWVISSGAKMLNSSFRGNNAAHAMMKEEYAEGMAYLHKNECTDQDEEFKDTYESPIKLSSYRDYLPPGTYFRK